MKVVGIAFALLIFNVCLSVAAHSSLTTGTLYYESNYINTFNVDDPDNSLPGNISTVSETQQYSMTMNIFDLVINVVDFGWLYYLIPDELDDDFAYMITGLQAIVGFLYAVAIIELFVKYKDLLGSN